MVKLRVYSNVTEENRNVLEDLLDSMFGKERKRGELEITIGNTVYVPRLQDGDNAVVVTDRT
jgi:hypothetical protein